MSRSDNVVASDLFFVDPATGKAQLRLHPGQVRAWDSNKRIIAIFSGTQAGKALALDTPIATPNGFIEIGGISVGDTVFDDRGKECRVIYVSPTMYDRPCYEIEFGNGETVIADAEHKWKVQSRNQRANMALRESRGKSNADAGEYYSILTTEEISRELFYQVPSSKGPQVNCSIDVCLPVEYPAKNLLIPPYTLGAWLGDGTSSCPVITISDQEIIEGIEKDGFELLPIKNANIGLARMYTIQHRGRRKHEKNPVTKVLQQLNVLKNKHIPDPYLHSSIAQRLEILRGLIDTDGHSYREDNIYGFTNINRVLIDNVRELLASLGIKSKIYEYRSKRNGQEGKMAYCVHFATSEVVSTIERKRQSPGKRSPRIYRHFISGVRPIKSVPLRCIQVDSPSHLFLITRSFIPTHNTSYGPWHLWREIQRNGGGDYLAVTSTYPLLQLKMLPEFLRVFHTTLKLGRWWDAKKIYELADPKTGKISEKSTDPMWGRVVFCSAVKADSLESATAKAAWLDEAGQSQFRIDAWEAILRRLSISRGRILITTTPYNLGWLYEEIYKPWASGLRNDIDVIQFKSIENPVFPEEEYYRAKRDLPSWKFSMFYDGLFARPAGMIYDCFDEEACVIPPREIPADWTLYVGVDFGGVHMAALFIAEDSATGDLYYFNEYLMGGKSIKQHAENFRKIVGNRPLLWVGGARPEEQWRQEFQEAGIPMSAPPINDVEVGIARVYAYHKQNKIFVFNTLKKYLDEKGSYARKLDERNNPVEDIEDKHSYHMMDAERVIVSAIFNMRNRVDASILPLLAEANRSRWDGGRLWSSFSTHRESRWQRGGRY